MKKKRKKIIKKKVEENGKNVQSESQIITYKIDDVSKKDSQNKSEKIEPSINKQKTFLESNEENHKDKEILDEKNKNKKNIKLKERSELETEKSMNKIQTNKELPQKTETDLIKISNNERLLNGGKQS